MNIARTSLVVAATFEDFALAAIAAGFDDATIRTWPPNAILDEHAHPFDAEAVIVHGAMWLSDAEGTRQLSVRDSFALPRGTVHSERYGSDGATYWVARRVA